jgi:hypothetical protein
MLIEFKIHLDGSGGATVTQASANAVNPGLPAHKQLAGAYVPNPGANAQPVIPPSPAASGSVSGTVIVIGPIVICGPGSGQAGPGPTGPGGDAPLVDPGP